jgi:hypothetical protein
LWLPPALNPFSAPRPGRPFGTDPEQLRRISSQPLFGKKNLAGLHLFANFRRGPPAPVVCLGQPVCGHNLHLRDAPTSGQEGLARQVLGVVAGEVNHQRRNESRIVRGSRLLVIEARKVFGQSRMSDRL